MAISVYEILLLFNKSNVNNLLSFVMDFQYTFLNRKKSTCSACTLSILIFIRHPERTGHVHLSVKTELLVELIDLTGSVS